MSAAETRLLTDQERVFCLRVAFTDDPLRSFQEVFDLPKGDDSPATWDDPKSPAFATLAAILKRDEIQSEIKAIRSWARPLGFPSPEWDSPDYNMWRTGLVVLLRKMLVGAETERGRLIVIDAARTLLLSDLYVLFGDPVTGLSRKDRQTRLARGLFGICRFLSAIGVEQQHVGEMLALMSAMFDLPDGIQPELLRKAKLTKRGRTQDPGGIWLARVYVAGAMMVLTKKAHADNSSAAVWIAENFPSLKLLKTREPWKAAHHEKDPTPLSDTIREWAGNFATEEVPEKAMWFYKSLCPHYEKEAAGLDTAGTVHFASELLQNAQGLAETLSIPKEEETLGG